MLLLLTACGADSDGFLDLDDELHVEATPLLVASPQIYNLNLEQMKLIDIKQSVLAENIKQWALTELSSTDKGRITEQTTTGFRFAADSVGIEQISYKVIGDKQTTDSDILISINDRLTTNDAPTADNIIGYTSPNQMIHFSLDDIIADNNQDQLTVKLESASTRFSLTNQQVSYNPQGFIGTDQAVYSVSDGYGGYALAYVIVVSAENNGNNNAPTTKDYSTSFDTSTASSLILDLEVLGLIDDEDDDQLKLVQLFGDNGRIQIKNSTSIEYRPGQFTGLDQFSYKVIDGHGGEAVGTVFIHTATTKLMAISITPVTTVIPKGALVTYQTLLHYENGAAEYVTRGVNWGTVDTRIASIDYNGIAQGQSVGNVVVTAAYAGQKANAELTVTEAQILSLTVTPEYKSVPKGVVVDYFARANYTDGSARDVTTDVSWSSANNDIVAIVSTTGKATAVNVGETTISATLNDKTDTATLTITPAQLSSLAISPDIAEIPVGLSQQYIAQASYTDGSTLDLSRMVNWAVGNEIIAKTGRYGLIKANAVGQVNVDATFQNMTDTAGLIATEPVLVDLILSPATDSIPLGMSVTYVVTGIYSDGVSRIISAAEVNWGSTVTEVANVIASTGEVTGGSIGRTTIMAEADGIQVSAKLTVTDAVLTSVQLTPTTHIMPKGHSVTYQVIGNYSNGVSHVIPASQVTWQSTNAAVASILISTGEAFGDGVGVTTIKATINGLSASVTLNVIDAVIEGLVITPVTHSMPLGNSLTYQVMATYSDGLSRYIAAENITWVSSNTRIATVLSNTGVVTGLSQGNAIITASVANQSVQAQLTVANESLVSLSISPQNHSMPVGRTIAHEVIAHYTNGDSRVIPANQINWKSDSVSVATIDVRNGVATGFDVGVSNITASYADQQVSSKLTVTDAAIVSIAMTPLDHNVPIGQTIAYQVNATYSNGQSRIVADSDITWGVSNAAVASIADTTGVATGLTSGQTDISATVADLTVSTSLTVTQAIMLSLSLSPIDHNMPKGNQVTYTVRGNYSDGVSREISATDVNWGTTDASVATVTSSAGIATGSQQGMTEIIATVNNQSTSANLTVTNAVLTDIVLRPAEHVMPLGESINYVVKGVYSDGIEQTITASNVVWRSSNPRVASVASVTGIATGAMQGNTQINASVSDLSASATLMVTDAVLISLSLSPTNINVPAGNTQVYQVTGHYSDGSRQVLNSSDVSWSSTAASVLNIDEQGVATGLHTGSSVIVAKVGDHSVETTIRVTEAVLTAISLSPAIASVAKGNSVNYTVTATYSDGHERVIAASDISWEASSPAIASVNNNTGVATGLSLGNTTIRATFGGFSDSTDLMVTDAALVSLTIDPMTKTLARGLTQAYVVTGIYSDNSEQVIPASSISWSSSNANVASIDRSTLIASANNFGVTTLTATVNSFDVSAILTVTAAALQSVTMKPEYQTIYTGNRLTYEITGTYSDGSTQIMSLTDFTWTSSFTGIASVTDGVALAKTVGMTMIRATYISDVSIFIDSDLTVIHGQVDWNSAYNDFGGFYNAPNYPNNYTVAVINNDNRIITWGLSSSGAIGAPVDSGYTAIASTASAFAGMKADGSIKAWGNDDSGGKGAPTTANYQRIYSNSAAFAALAKNGSVTAWGHVGTGGVGAPIDNGYHFIASTANAFAALKKGDGSIYAWGQGISGGVGAPTEVGYRNIIASRAAFTAIKEDGSLISWGDISAAPSDDGYIHVFSTSDAFAALKSDGYIHSWGGQYGGTGAPIDTGYKTIYSTLGAFAALKHDGSITAWGSTSYGSRGYPTETGYRHITATHAAFAALHDDGHIVAWGNSTYGGTGAPLGNSFVQIYSNQYAFAALDDTGRITVWGNPLYGGVGAPTDNGYSRIYATSYSFSAIKKDGTVKVWGSLGDTAAPNNIN